MPKQKNLFLLGFSLTFHYLCGCWIEYVPLKGGLIGSCPLLSWREYLIGPASKRYEIYDTQDVAGGACTIAASHNERL
jgi:hypothetical protein